MNARANRTPIADKTSSPAAGERAAFDTMLARHRRFLRRRRRGGASLVEVLVVLVILLLGVFAVIRVWPIGFGTLRASERRLRADRLNRNTLDQVAGADAASLPEAIEFSFYTGTGKQTITGAEADPDNLGVYLGEPANKLYFSDVNKFRYVKNEPVKVPPPTNVSGVNTYGANGRGSIYLVKFGPIYMSRTVGTPDNAPASDPDQALYDSYLRVTSEPLSRLGSPDSANGTNGGNFLGRFRRNGGGYFIDYGGDGGGAWILFPPADRERKYVVTYSYEDTSGAGTVKEQPETVITVPAATFPVWQQLPLPATLGEDDGIVPGSEEVKLNFQRLPASAAFDPGDPYQFKLISENVSDFANFGVVAFNPAGANYSERTPYGQRAFGALLSYAVLDWHILKDDREVPAGVQDATAGVPIAQIRTTLPNIRPKDDDLLPDEVTDPAKTKYEGLYPGANPADPKASADIQAFNLSSPTGDPLVIGDYSDRGTTAANADIWVNREGRNGTYPTGILYVNTARVPAGSRLRVLYKVQGNWAVAVQKAVTTYDMARDTDGVPNNLPAADTTGSFGIDGTRLIFHRSELNKSVVGALEYALPSGEVKRLSPQQFTIDTAEGDYATVDVRRFIPAADLAAPLSGLRLVNNEVRGASLRTRVVYKDNTTATNPWRVQDLETFVTPAPQGF
jgi:hypothetical protein